MLRFQRNPGFKLLSPRRFQPRGRFANFQVCLFVKLAAGLFLQNSAFFNLFTAVASEMTAHWFSNFFQVIFYFVCLFVCLLSWHIFLQSPLIRTIWYRFQETWKKAPVFLHFPTIFVCLFVKLFSLLFKISFVCLFVKLFFFLSSSLKRQTNDHFGNFFFQIFKASPYYRGKKLVEFDWKSLKFSNFSTFWLFLCKTAFFFLPSCQSNDKFGSFFSQIFKGFTLVPWQKVGRIWLGFAGKHSNFKFSLFLPKSLANPSLPFPCIRTIRHQFNFFNFFLFDLVCYYFMFHSGFSKRNFWFGVKNSFLAGELVKLAICHLFLPFSLVKRTIFM